MIESLIFKTRKLAKIVAEPAWRYALLKHHVAAGVEHRIVLGNLGEVCTIVDIGANRGQFALVARLCLPSSHIISFEPLPRPASVYRSLFADDPNVILYESAVGPSVGKSIIHISRRDDSSSLLPISATQSLLFPGTHESSTAEINVGPLSTYVTAVVIKRPALLKLDVQGFELQALAGCKDLLAEFDWVYVECSFIELYEGQAFADEVIAWLHDMGLGLRGVHNMAYDNEGRAVQADFLFARIESR